MRCAEIEFAGAGLVVVMLGDEAYVGVRSVCAGLRLAPAAQERRVERLAELGSRRRQLRRGDAPALLVPLGQLNGWLGGIDRRRASPAMRERLALYQRDAARVIAQQLGLASTPDLPAQATRWLVRRDEKGRETLQPLLDEQMLLAYDDLPRLIEAGAVTKPTLMRILAASSSRVLQLENRLTRGSSRSATGARRRGGGGTGGCGPRSA